MKRKLRLLFGILCVALLAACGPDDMLWPSDKIGRMWVNRYGHSNSVSIWEVCPDAIMPGAPGTKISECTVPWMDELFIGYGVGAVDKETRDALWEARTWELYIDGYAVDLPAFNIADFDADLENGLKYEYRVWRIRLRNIPAGEHSLRYVMQVNQQIANDPEGQSPGTYELIVNFIFEEKK